MLRELVTAALRRVADDAFASLRERDDDGVVRLPSEFSRTSGSPPSMTAMQEFCRSQNQCLILCHKIVVVRSPRHSRKARAFQSCAGGG